MFVFAASVYFIGQYCELVILPYLIYCVFIHKSINQLNQHKLASINGFGLFF